MHCSCCRKRTRTAIFLYAVALAAPGVGAATATLRIAAYNVDLDSTTSTTAPNSSIASVLEDVGSETTYNGAHLLDVIGLEETYSNSVSVQPLVNTLNSYYGTAASYAMSTVQGTYSGSSPIIGNGPNAVIYNTKTLTLVSSVGVGTPGGSSNGEYRQVMRYQFRPVGGTSSQDFYVYVSHMKSGDASEASGSTTVGALRNGEAQIITADEAKLGSGASFVVMGDLNMDGSTEAAYQTLVGSGLTDPLNPTNASQTWAGNNTYKSILTESTQTSFSYRDDLQLMSTNIYNGSSGAITYVAGTEHAFGNNGSVSAGADFMLKSTSPYASELNLATDHLPIVADYSYTVPSPEPASLALLLTSVPMLARRRRGPCPL